MTIHNPFPILRQTLDPLVTKNQLMWFKVNVYFLDVVVY